MAKKRGRPAGYKTSEKTKQKISVSEHRYYAEKKGLPMTRGKKIEKSESKKRDLGGCILCHDGGDRSEPRYSVKAIQVGPGAEPWANTQLNFVSLCRRHCSMVGSMSAEKRSRFSVLAVYYLKHIYKPLLKDGLVHSVLSDRNKQLMSRWDDYIQNYVLRHAVEASRVNEFLSKTDDNIYIDFWQDVRIQLLGDSFILEADLIIEPTETEENIID